MATPRHRALTIPQGEEDSARGFMRMDPSQLEWFVEVMTAARPALSIDQLVRQLGEPPLGLSVRQVRGAVRVVVGICLSMHHRGMSPDETVEVALPALKGAQDSSSTTDLGSHAEALRKLLPLPVLIVTAKAANVMVQSERPFKEAQVLTDLRSVFAGDHSAAPPAAVVVHNLRLAFYRNDLSAHEDLYFALDRSEVETLIGVLRSALAKEDAIRSALGDSIAILDLPGAT